MAYLWTFGTVKLELRTETNTKKRSYILPESPQDVCWTTQFATSWTGKSQCLFFALPVHPKRYPRFSIETIWFLLVESHDQSKKKAWTSRILGFFLEITNLQRGLEKKTTTYIFIYWTVKTSTNQLSNSLQKHPKTILMIYCLNLTAPCPMSHHQVTSS